MGMRIRARRRAAGEPLGGGLRGVLHRGGRLSPAGELPPGADGEHGRVAWPAGWTAESRMDYASEGAGRVRRSPSRNPKACGMQCRDMTWPGSCRHGLPCVILSQGAVFKTEKRKPPRQFDDVAGILEICMVPDPDALKLVPEALLTPALVAAIVASSAACSLFPKSTSPRW